eukprot:6177190-Pleurochrysis_carterae.AAC.1
MKRALSAAAVGAPRAPFTCCSFAPPRALRFARRFLARLGGSLQCMPVPQPAFRVAVTLCVAHVR